MRICHLGAIKERLCDMKVLVILDDVNDVKQLEALANETWFGLGSRIIVTTENKDLLRQHGINNTYHVKFPCREEALEILCRYAFRQSSPRLGFKKLAESVTWLCGDLPLGLRVVGSSLYGKNEDEWKYTLCRLETIIDRDIEDVLKVGYESLHENEKSLFLHIAVFFNNKDGELVKAMLADKKLNIEHGLNILESKSLISRDGGIRMHKLLQQVGIQANQREEPCKRRILIDAQDICYALENETGNGIVSGILFDTSGINEVTISKRALRRMVNLRFLRVYKSSGDGNDRMDIPEDMEFPPLLRLLDWDAYPAKCLPLKFRAENLVELNMRNSQLEYLWQGTQMLTNLKKMDLSCSAHLKELPDLSFATNLEKLDVSFCRALIELPSSIGNLQKLDKLNIGYCESLQVIPTHINLASLEVIYLTGCLKLKSFPVFSTTIRSISLQRTGVEEVAASVRHCSKLLYIYITECRTLKSFTHLPTSLQVLDLSMTDIEMIPDCIKDLQWLDSLRLFRCTKLKALPELPGSLTLLTAEDCESLERVTYPLNTPNAQLNFTNSFKLGEEAQRAIIQQPFLDGSACFHGSTMPSEFNHRARGSSVNITLPSSGSSTFKACVVISPNHRQHARDCRIVTLGCRLIDNRGWYNYIKSVFLRHPEKSTGMRTKHLCIFHGTVPEVSNDAVFEVYISSENQLDNYKIIECGVQILTNEVDIKSDRGSVDYDYSSYDVDNDRYEFDDFNDVLYDSEDGLISCDSESDEQEKTSDKVERR
ncbi:PREDICTED: disease resistance protein RML1A-like isoform X2 [Camelina sativa]|nr:PREDICTED: disease resistance protein RML1A-like isoform X2 [Camelina sativa]